MTEQERQERMEKLFEKMLNMEMTNREIYEQCRNVAHKPMTNEEWFDSLTTEEKATVIYGIAMYDTLYDRIHNAFVLNPCEDDSAGINEVMKWLKEKHDGNMGRNP